MPATRSWSSTAAATTRARSPAAAPAGRARCAAPRASSPGIRLASDPWAWETPGMLVRGVEDIQVVQEQAALLRIAMLVARDEPLDSLFGAVSAEVSQLLHVDAGAVLRSIGGERAVIVGVHRTGGVRGLPVNAELDFDRSR